MKKANTKHLPKETQDLIKKVHAASADRAKEIAKVKRRIAREEKLSRGQGPESAA